MRVCSALFMLWSSVALSSTTAEVERVIDGDTVQVVMDGNRETLRLQCIDAPERDQPYGTESTSFLRSQISGQTLDVDVVDEDRYGRLLAYLTVEGRDINRVMVESGFAWNYDYYCGDQYRREQDVARARQRGLWIDPFPINPYDWRRGNY